MNDRTQGMLGALLCVSLWGLLPVVSKLGQTTLDSHQFLFWSSICSTICVFLLCWKTQTLRVLKSYTLKNWGQSVGLGVLGTYLYFLLLYKGYAGGRDMEVLVIQYTWPIMVALLSCWLLGEVFDWRKGTALLLGFTAVTLVLTKGQLHKVSLDRPELLLWVGLGAFCFAVFSVFSKGIKLETFSLQLVFFITATVASFFSMLWFSHFALPDRHCLIVVAVSGIVVNGLSDVLWLWSLRKTEASYLAPVVFLSPVLCAVYMQLFFHEPFLPIYSVGLILIVMAGLVNNLNINLRLKKRPVA